MFCIIRNLGPNQQGKNETTVVCWGNPDKSQSGPLFFETTALAKEFIRDVASDTPLEGPWLIRDADHCFYADDIDDCSDSFEAQLSFRDVVLVDGQNRSKAFREREHASSMWIIEQWGQGRYLWMYNGKGDIGALPKYTLTDLGYRDEDDEE